MTDRPNIPVPDELAVVREQIQKLTEREKELRKLLIAHADLREGAAYLAEIKVTPQMRTDLKEMRACHPEIVEQFTFPVPVVRVELSGITEDGEIVSLRQLRKEAATQ
jgi:hypothetical protein